MSDLELESGFSNPLPETVPVADLVVLERLNPMTENADELHQLIDENRDFYLTFTPGYSMGLSNIHQAEAFLRNAQKAGVMLWGLRIGSQKSLAGMLTLVPEESGVYDLGYILHEQAQGRGLITRSVRALAAEVFAQGGTKISAKVSPINDKSRAVLERCGFQPAGVDEQGNQVYELQPHS